jgi:hypothetical protein
MNSLQKKLIDRDADEFLIAWASDYVDSETAWAECTHGDLLIRIACNLGVDHATLVCAGCAAARVSLPYVMLGDDGPRQAIEVAERWCAGLASIEEVQAAAKGFTASDRSAAWYGARPARHVAAARCAAYYAVVAIAQGAGVVASDCASFAAYAARDNVVVADVVRSVIPWSLILTFI